MAKWSFLTNHARALVCIARDPGVRLREMAVTLDITERSAFGIVTELVGAGYVVKAKEGRRNRYRIQGHLPLRDSVARERTIGEVLDVLVKASPAANADQPRPFVLEGSGNANAGSDHHSLDTHGTAT
jgi:hypothetical protein